IQTPACRFASKTPIALSSAACAKGLKPPRGIQVKKVVVTGMGCVSGLGADVASNWAALIDGKTAIQPIRKCCEGTEDISIDCVAAPVVKEALDELRKAFPEKQIASVDIFANLGAAATLEALKDAKLFGDRERLAKAAIIYGSASGGNVTVEA